MRGVVPAIPGAGHSTGRRSCQAARFATGGHFRMTTLLHHARHLAETLDPQPRANLLGAALVFEASCAMNDDEPDKQPRVALAWARLKALVESASDAD